MTDNIVSFPKNKIVRESIQNNEEIEKIKTKGTQNFADTIIHDIAETLLNDLGAIGLDTDSEAFSKDFHFLVCILGATVYRTLNLEHPFHEFLSEHVSFKEIDESELDKLQ